MSNSKRITDSNELVVAFYDDHKWICSKHPDFKIIETSDGLTVRRNLCNKDANKNALQKATNLEMQHRKNMLNKREDDLKHLERKLRSMQDIMLDGDESINDEYVVLSIMCAKHRREIKEIRDQKTVNVKVLESLKHEDFCLQRNVWTSVEWHPLPIVFTVGEEEASLFSKCAHTVVTEVKEVHNEVKVVDDGFQVGDVVDCRDVDGYYFAATIMIVGEVYYSVIYNQWGREYSEWIRKDSQRISPAGTHELLYRKFLVDKKEPDEDKVSESLFAGKGIENSVIYYSQADAIKSVANRKGSPSKQKEEQRKEIKALMIGLESLFE